MAQKAIKHLIVSCLSLFTWLMGDERGAELRTLEPVLYGKFEARYKPAQGEGIVLSLIHISEPTRPEPISYAVFCLKKKK